MPFDWIYTADNLNWDELAQLYAIAPLAIKDPARLKIAFGNSMFKIFVYDAGKLVAAGRALADGADCAYLCDIAVHPDYQGQGLGKELVSQLVHVCQGHKKIILYAAVGKEPFYKKFGFKRMKTAMAIFENQAQALARGLVDDS